MAKSWMSLATFVVVISLVMILHDRLPSPIGDLGLVLFEGLDSSLQWIRDVFVLKTSAYS